MKLQNNVVSGKIVRKLGIFAWNPITCRKEITRRMVLVYQWQRDCDMCERDSVVAIPAGRRYFAKVERDLYDGAEGPGGIYTITPEDAAEFSPSFRDRVLEAFEEGEYYNV